MMHLSTEQAQGFYAVHSERPFFNDLVSYMTSGPVVVQALEGDNAIARNREIMGATNPSEADPDTIRADFADNMTENAAHGSDSPASAERNTPARASNGVSEALAAARWQAVAFVGALTADLLAVTPVKS